MRNLAVANPCWVYVAYGRGAGGAWTFTVWGVGCWEGGLGTRKGQEGVYGPAPCDGGGGRQG